MRFAPALLLSGVAAGLMAAAAPASAESAEAQLRRVLAAVTEGRLNAALDDAAKNWIKVGVSNLSVLRSAGPAAVIEVAFDQDYGSDKLSQRARKRQYGVEENERWKIAYENTIGGPKLRLPESFKSAVRTKGARS